MDSASLLLQLRRELRRFQACLSGDLSARIEHCGDWTLHHLAEHLGGENMWAAAAVTEGHGDCRPPAAPRDPAALARWFEESCAALLRALEADPRTSAWTFHPPHTVGFWRRRRCLETAVHRWDAERALGMPSSFDAELAGEGIAEVFDTMAPRQIARGRANPPEAALRLVATDTGAGTGTRTGASWTYGEGVPAATLYATAEDLLLLLWGRMPVSGEAFAWEGDRRTGLRILDGPWSPDLTRPDPTRPDLTRPDPT